MPVTAEDVKRWATNFESQTMDLKSYGILSHPEDLAGLMVAFANNKFVSQDYGGRIIIGIDNGGNIEDFIPKQGHEEHIMNIARDKCFPSIQPEFEKVAVDGKSVYVITIPKMTNFPYQLITPQGRSHRIRVGSTIREPNSEELAKLYDNSISNTPLSKTVSIESLLSRIDGPIRKITIIPVDANSKLITLDKNNTTWLQSEIPRYVVISKATLSQNEIHYQFDSGARKTHGIINDFGHFSFVEQIEQEQPVSRGYEQNPIVSIEREIYFILSILEYIKKVYSKFNYQQRILITYSQHNVQNYSFTYSNFMRAGYHRPHIIQKSDFSIVREIDLSSLNEKALLGSILEEMARVANWPVIEGDFSRIIDELHKEGGF